MVAQPCAGLVAAEPAAAAAAAVDGVRVSGGEGSCIEAVALIQEPGTAHTQGSFQQ